MDSRKNQAFAVLFAVFLGGAATGALGLKLYQNETAKAAIATPAETPRPQANLAAEHLREELDLDAKQVSQVQDILDQCIMLEADLLTQLALTRTDGRDRILKILNQEQRQKFESLLLEFSAPQ